MRSQLGTKPEAARQHVRLEDRFNDDLQGCLHDPVANRRDRERSLLAPARLGDEVPPGRERLEPPLPQFCGQFVEQPVDAVALDLGDGGLVDARCAGVAAHLLPRPL
jgi:hypothetical protein